jgi:predicted regulator of Ras-like GTPase activity (Roadblock/LC7/MglB family)
MTAWDEAPGEASGAVRGEPTPARAVGADTLVDRVRQIPGVSYAVVQGKDGTRAGDDGHEAEAPAGQAAYLMMVCSQLGAAFGAGDLHRAAVQGTTRHLLLLANKRHYLGVLIRAENQVAAVESDVKRALASIGERVRERG